MVLDVAGSSPVIHPKTFAVSTLASSLVVALAASCSGGGHGVSDAGRPDAAGPGPACGAGCSSGATCVASACQCLPGYVGDGATCVPETVSSDLEARTPAEVCARWKAGQVVTASTQYVPGTGGMCDPGTITDAAVYDAANRWSMYRWLVGLPPVGVDRTNAADMQQCALVLGYDFRHDPPPTTTWYTAGGADAASRSMICSAQDAAGCMDLYTLESYATDNRLSHRKIVVGTNRDNVNFGVSSGGSCALYGYGTDPPTTPAFTAVPNPGPTPIAMARSTWSLHQTSAALPIGDTQVFDETAGAPVGVQQNLRYAGINGWDLTSPVIAGHTYRVTLSDGTSTIEYRTTPVDCP